MSEARLHIVTGKGGTGKTTLAAALALALASSGRRILLCEVEGRQGIASAFDIAPLPYGERRIAAGVGGGAVDALAIDAEAALLEYLDMFYRLGRAGKALDRFDVIDFATTVAPGVRDVVLIGKVYEAVRRSEKSKPTYDAVVLDGPPTGRIGRVLNVNAEVAGIAKVGPIRNQADSIMRLLKSRQSVVHLVTTLEEMPVQETLDCLDELQRIGVNTGLLVVNMVRAAQIGPRDLKAAQRGLLDAGKIATSLKEAGLTPDDRMVAGLVDEVREHAQRVALEHQQRSRLVDTRLPIISLGYLSDGVDLANLYSLAENVASSGAL
ncbi:MAG: ArsA-related P-loop ATPase [Nocardioidaceae bacterium]